MPAWMAPRHRAAAIPDCTVSHLHAVPTTGQGEQIGKSDHIDTHHLLRLCGAKVPNGASHIDAFWMDSPFSQELQVWVLHRLDTSLYDHGHPAMIHSKSPGSKTTQKYRRSKNGVTPMRFRTKFFFKHAAIHAPPILAPNFWPPAKNWNRSVFLQTGSVRPLQACSQHLQVQTRNLSVLLANLLSVCRFRSRGSRVASNILYMYTSD